PLDTIPNSNVKPLRAYDRVRLLMLKSVIARTFILIEKVPYTGRFFIVIKLFVADGCAAGNRGAELRSSRLAACAATRYWSRLRCFYITSMLAPLQHLCDASG
ncbi:MAG: hypothetical protein CSA09_05245, partial [Candidatus Contendobacter odensis]